MKREDGPMMKKMKIAAAMILCLCMLTAVFPAAEEEADGGYACIDIFFGPEEHQLRSDPVAVDDIGPIYQCGVCNGYFYGDGTPAQVNLE